jgi:hypothetical protein
MKDLLDKISSYHIFNSLFPGILFAILAEKITSYKYLQNDILTGLFLYYFIGLVINRIGSVVIEPIFRKFSIVKFSNYKEYVEASKKDEKIELLSEINNMYRTVIATMFSLMALKLYELIELKLIFLKSYTPFILIMSLFFLFLSAYRKQTRFISERISLRRKTK